MKKAQFTDRNGKLVSPHTILPFLEFSKEDYDKKRLADIAGTVSFNDFLENVTRSVRKSDGDFDDAVFIANDAFRCI